AERVYNKSTPLINSRSHGLVRVKRILGVLLSIALTSALSSENYKKTHEKINMYLQNGVPCMFMSKQDGEVVESLIGERLWYRIADLILVSIRMQAMYPKRLEELKLASTKISLVATDKIATHS
ncbi:unnamed protein product, partial [Dovyalis caffra]